MASCPICREPAADDAPICYKCGSALVWPRSAPTFDYRRRYRAAGAAWAAATIAAAILGPAAFLARHSGPHGTWPPALHALIPGCTVAWFSTAAAFAVRRQAYRTWLDAKVGAPETDSERQPLAVPNRLMLS